MATPLEISMAIWYCTRAGDYGKDFGDFNFAAPAVQETILRFADLGLLDRAPADAESNWVASDGLKLYVDTLCLAPWPEKKWVMPSQN